MLRCGDEMQFFLIVSLSLIFAGMAGGYSTYKTRDINGQMVDKSPGSSRHLARDPEKFHDTFEANRHYNEMVERTACREPRPVVVDIQKFYHNSSVEYLPHCTILHRCDHESGCCRKGHVCQAKSKEFVHLHFYAAPIDKTRGASEVIKLTFTNHTTCQCEEDLEYAEIHKVRTTSTLPPVDTEEEYDDEISCKRCPRPFATRILGESQCTCDCFHADKECLDIKRGHKHMKPEYSNCVRRDECEPPTCQTGDFDSIRGTCPRLCRQGKIFDFEKGRCTRIRHKRKPHHL